MNSNQFYKMIKSCNSIQEVLTRIMDIELENIELLELFHNLLNDYNFTISRTLLWNDEKGNNEKLLILNEKFDGTRNLLIGFHKLFDEDYKKRFMGNEAENFEDVLYRLCYLDYLDISYTYYLYKDEKNKYLNVCDFDNMNKIVTYLLRKVTAKDYEDFEIAKGKKFFYNNTQDAQNLLVRILDYLIFKEFYNKTFIRLTTKSENEINRIEIEKTKVSLEVMINETYNRLNEIDDDRIQLKNFIETLDSKSKKLVSDNLEFDLKVSKVEEDINLIRNEKEDVEKIVSNFNSNSLQIMSILVAAFAIIGVNIGTIPKLNSGMDMISSSMNILGIISINVSLAFVLTLLFYLIGVVLEKERQVVLLAKMLKNIGIFAAIIFIATILIA